MRTWLLLALVALGIGCEKKAAPEPAALVTSSAASVSASPSSSGVSTPAIKPATAVAHREMEAFVQGRKIGEMTCDREPLADGGFRLTIHSMLVFKIADDNPDVRTVDGIQVQEFSSALVMTKSSDITKEKGAEERVDLTLVDRSLQVVIDKPSHHDEKKLPVPGNWSTETAVFYQLRARAMAGEKLPITHRYMEFDDDDVDFTPHTFTLLEKTRVKTKEGEVDAWKAEQRNEKDGDTAKTVYDDEGMPLRYELGVLLVTPKGMDGGKPAEMAQLNPYLSVDGVVSPKDESVTVELTVTGDGADPTSLFVEGPYQKVERKGDLYTLTLLRVSSKGAKAPKLPLLDAPENIGKFLKPTSTSQSNDPKIIEKAKSIVGSEQDSRVAAEAIVKWVFKNLGKADGVRGTASAVETLNAGKGDCTEHAALTVALARAAGIPARNVTGIVLVPGKKTEAGYHAWPEFWLGEWVVLDPALGTFDAGPHYIWLGYDEPGEVHGTGRMARLIGRTKIAIKN